jgi:hypothetical protein
MINFCAVCGCCTRTDIIREHLEDTLRICDVSAMALYARGLFFRPCLILFLQVENALATNFLVVTTVTVFQIPGNVIKPVTVLIRQMKMNVVCSLLFLCTPSI